MHEDTQMEASPTSAPMTMPALIAKADGTDGSEEAQQRRDATDPSMEAWDNWHAARMEMRAASGTKPRSGDGDKGEEVGTQ